MEIYREYIRIYELKTDLLGKAPNRWNFLIFHRRGLLHGDPWNICLGSRTSTRISLPLLQHTSCHLWVYCFLFLKSQFHHPLSFRVITEIFYVLLVNFLLFHLCSLKAVASQLYGFAALQLLFLLTKKYSVEGIQFQFLEGLQNLMNFQFVSPIFMKFLQAEPELHSVIG